MISEYADENSGLKAGEVPKSFQGLPYSPTPLSRNHSHLTVGQVIN